MAVIILVGFMGCGKTTLGKKLAKQLNYEFMDADTAIEQQNNLSIQEIFAQQGEARFRELEREFILSIKNKKNVVLATGGGMPCFGDNMKLLNESGITLYLQRPIPELVHRLVNAKKIRPLIQGKNEAELTDFITELLPVREVFYLQSKYVLTREQQNILFIQTLLNSLI